MASARCSLHVSDAVDLCCSAGSSVALHTVWSTPHCYIDEALLGCIQEPQRQGGGGREGTWNQINDMFIECES